MVKNAIYEDLGVAMSNDCTFDHHTHNAVKKLFLQTILVNYTIYTNLYYLGLIYLGDLVAYM